MSIKCSVLMCWSVDVRCSFSKSKKLQQKKKKAKTILIEFHPSFPNTVLITS